MDFRRSCMTLSAIYLGNYGTIVHQGRAAFVVSTVVHSLGPKLLWATWIPRDFLRHVNYELQSAQPYEVVWNSTKMALDRKLKWFYITLSSGPAIMKLVESGTTTACKWPDSDFSRDVWPSSSDSSQTPNAL